MNYRKLKRYKYQLMSAESITLPSDLFVNLPLNALIETTDGWVKLDLRTRQIHIRKGYCWDGPSGPTIDTPNFMRGSLFHDAWYQIFRELGFYRQWKDDADRLLERHCIEDGMSKIRAAWVYWGVKTFGRRAAGG